MILASFTYPFPVVTLPSTGILAPVFTRRISPSSTSSISTSANCPPVNCLKAVSGAISVNSLIADRVWLSVRCSKYDPNKNKKVTIADSS